VVRVQIVATDAGPVFDALAPRFGHTVRLRVQAMASEQEMHHRVIGLHVGQSPISATLAPPPSTPALPLSKIEVGIALIGADIAVNLSELCKQLQLPKPPRGYLGEEGCWPKFRGAPSCQDWRPRRREVRASYPNRFA
jgi:hypothetical protein